MQTVIALMPAGRHDLDSKGGVLKRCVRLAVADLAIDLAPGRQEDLKLAQAIQLARQRVEGFEVFFLRDGLAATPWV